jgi:hypothetical protein
MQDTSVYGQAAKLRRVDVKISKATDRDMDSLLLSGLPFSIKNPGQVYKAILTVRVQFAEPQYRYQSFH